VKILRQATQESNNTSTATAKQLSYSNTLVKLQQEMQINGFLLAPEHFVELLSSETWKSKPLNTFTPLRRKLRRKWPHSAMSTNSWNPIGQDTLQRHNTTTYRQNRPIGGTNSIKTNTYLEIRRANQKAVALWMPWAEASNWGELPTDVISHLTKPENNDSDSEVDEEYEDTEEVGDDIADQNDDEEYTIDLPEEENLSPCVIMFDDNGVMQRCGKFNSKNQRNISNIIGVWEIDKPTVEDMKKNNQLERLGICVNYFSLDHQSLHDIGLKQTKETGNECTVQYIVVGVGEKDVNSMHQSIRMSSH
ncbi:10615_t:CDS:2, partial [Paraglomus occultum]